MQCKGVSTPALHRRRNEPHLLRPFNTNARSTARALHPGPVHPLPYPVCFSGFLEPNERDATRGSIRFEKDFEVGESWREGGTALKVGAKKGSRERRGEVGQEVVLAVPLEGPSRGVGRRRGSNADARSQI